jgi:autotransporter-associated beta strand protein
MKTTRFVFNFAFLIGFTALLFGFSALVGKVSAAGCSWTGGFSINWADSGNWGAGCTGAGGIPGATDTITFPAGASNLSNNDNIAGALSLTSIVFSDTGYDLHASVGSTVTLTGGLTNGTGTNVISTVPLTLSGSQSFTSGSGSIQINGTVVLPAAGILTVDSANFVYFGGVVSGTGGITKIGAGNLTLSGTNTYSGTTTISVGYVNLPNANGFGNTAGSTSISSTATVNITGSINIPEPLILNGGNGNVGAGAVRNFTSNATWSGTISLNAANTFIQSETGLTLTLSGVISETGAGNGLSLSTNGTGKILLTNNNTYTGTTNADGDVYINGSQIGSNLDITGTTGHLSGNGGSVQDITVSQTDSSVSPVTISGTPSQLTATALSMNGASGQFMSYVLNNTTPGSGYSKLNVNGTVSLNTGVALTLSGSYVPHKGDVFTLIDNDGTVDPVTSNFAGLPEGTNILFNGVNSKISYIGGDGNNVTLTVQNSIPVVALTSSANPSLHSHSINITASVTGNAGVATGTVTFFEGLTNLGTVPLNGSGQAVLSISSLSVGSHNISANYSGDTNYVTGSVLAPFAQVVTPSLSGTGVSVPVGLLAGLSLVSFAGMLISTKKKFLK